MKTIDYRAIIQKYTAGKMCSRPEFYSGRGAITSDLNSKLLEMIYQGVLTELGKERAAAFVQFVADFDKLAATTFLQDFNSFCQGYDKPRKHTPADELDPGPEHEARGLIAAAGMMSYFSCGSDRDETEMIRGMFLHQHREEYTPKPGQKRANVFGYWGE